MALEASPESLTWVNGAWVSDGGSDPTQVKTIEELALYAHGTGALPPGVEGGLDAQTVYTRLTRDPVRRDPIVHDGPVQVVEERVDVGAAVGLEVEEVRVLVDVERDQRRRVPDREGALGVADVVEQPADVPVVRGPGPAAAGHPSRLQIRAPRLSRAEVTLDQLGERAVGVAALAAEVLEVDLVVLDPTDREREIDLQRRAAAPGRQRAVRGSRFACSHSPRRACSAPRPTRARSTSSSRSAGFSPRGLIRS